MQIIADPEHSGNEDWRFLSWLRPIAGIVDSWHLRLLELSHGSLGKGCQSAPAAQVDDADASRAQSPPQFGILPVDVDQLRRQRMRTGRREEMMLGEIDANQADARRPQMSSQAQRHIRRVLGVMQHLVIVKIGAAEPAESKPHYRRLHNAEIVALGEQETRPRILDITESVAAELPGSIDHHEIGRIEPAADIVDADGHATRRFPRIVQRLAAAADNDRFAVVPVAEIRQQPQVLGGRRRCRRDYDHALLSAAVSWRCSLAYSPRAAAIRCDMRTGSPASAARNAALTAILRMLPPATRSCASLAKFSASVGVADGKARHQMRRRCAVSGNGNSTIKRSRRRNAGSSAVFILVVRIAKPRYASMRCRR